MQKQTRTKQLDNFAELQLLRERGGRGLSSHSAVKISYERCGQVVSH